MTKVWFSSLRQKGASFPIGFLRKVIAFLELLFAVGSDYFECFQNATARATLKSTNKINIKNDLAHNSWPLDTISYSTGKPTGHAFYIAFSFS